MTDIDPTKKDPKRTFDPALAAEIGRKISGIGYEYLAGADLESWFSSVARRADMVTDEVHFWKSDSGRWTQELQKTVEVPFLGAPKISLWAAWPEAAYDKSGTVLPDKRSGPFLLSLMLHDADNEPFVSPLFKDAIDRQEARDFEELLNGRYEDHEKADINIYFPFEAPPIAIPYVLVPPVRGEDVIRTYLDLNASDPSSYPYHQLSPEEAARLVNTVTHAECLVACYDIDTTKELG